MIDKPEMYAISGNAIDNFLEIKCFSRSYASKMIGRSRSYITQSILKGRMEVSAIEQLCSLLGCDFEDIAEGYTSEEIPPLVINISIERDGKVLQKRLKI